MSLGIVIRNNNLKGIMRIPTQGGEPVVLRPKCIGCWSPAISADGEYIYFAGTASRIGLLLRANMAGGEEEAITTDLHSSAYALAGERLYYIARRGSNGFPIMERGLPSGKTRQIAALPTDLRNVGAFLGARRSGTETVLVYAPSRTLISDLMLVENFR